MLNLQIGNSGLGGVNRGALESVPPSKAARPAPAVLPFPAFLWSGTVVVTPASSQLRLPSIPSPARDAGLGSRTRDASGQKAAEEPLTHRELSQDRDPMNDEIDALYKKLAALVVAGGRRSTRARLFAKLRRLQTREAEVFRVEFERSLLQPIDAGRQAIERIDALLRMHEGPAAAHGAAQEADD